MPNERAYCHDLSGRDQWRRKSRSIGRRATSEQLMARSLPSTYESVYIVHRNSLIKATFTRSYHIFATGRSRSRIYYTTVIRTVGAMLRAGHADDAHVSNADDNWDGRVTRVHYATGDIRRDLMLSSPIFLRFLLLRWRWNANRSPRSKDYFLSLFFHSFIDSMTF